MNDWDGSKDLAAGALKALAIVLVIVLALTMGGVYLALWLGWIAP